MNGPPPTDGICEECGEPLGADYQERLIGMIGDTEVVDLRLLPMQMERRLT